MTAPTIAVTCVANDQNGNPVAGAVFTAQLDSTEVYQGFVVPERVQAVANATGIAVLNLWPNALGVAGSLYRVTAVNPDTGRKFLDTTISVPNSPCNLHEILVQGPYPTLDAAAQALVAAQEALAAATATLVSEDNTAASAAAAAEAAAIAGAGAATATSKAGEAVASAEASSNFAASVLSIYGSTVAQEAAVAASVASAQSAAGSATAAASQVDLAASAKTAAQAALATVTAQADIATAKAVLTAADVVLTHADVLTTAGHAAATAADVLTLAPINAAMPALLAVQTNLADINAVENNLTQIGAVATDVLKVNTVANNIGSVNTTANNIGSVNTVAGSIASVNSAATNMDAILAAPAQASAAASSSAAASASALAAQNAAINSVYVTGDQTIAGVKTFSGGIELSGSRFYQSSVGIGFEIGPGAGTGDINKQGIYVPVNKILALSTGNGTALEIGTSGSTFTGNLNVPSLNGGQLAGLRNLIINGNFAINQRNYVSGAAVGAANTYTLDRWRIVVSDQAATFSALGNGRTVTAPSGGIEQVIEGASIAGGTYVINWTGTATCTVNGIARAKGATFALTANANATVRFIGGTVSVVQLEPGTVATVFEARPYSMEKQLCDWYCEVLGGADALESLASGYLNTALSGAFFLRYKEKRAAPTISVSAASHFSINVLDLAGQATTTLTFTGIGKTSCRVNAFFATAATDGQGSLLRANTTAARIIISAEL